jgi:hypothetical protein
MAWKTKHCYLTKEQRKRLLEVYNRDRSVAPSYREFRKNVSPLLGGNGCVMVPWKGMWLGIETDGYCHS